MATHAEETIIPFSPDSTTSSKTDQLDRAGQTVLQLLNKAASVAEENSRRAIDMAERLSQQLRAAEGRVAELEAEAATYQEQAERAAQWLHPSLHRDRGTQSNVGSLMHSSDSHTRVRQGIPKRIETSDLVH